MSTWIERFINIWSNDNSNSVMILDPLTTILHLALLSFKPIGTKLSIYKNTISFVEPGAFQGFYRWSFGDGRNDLHNIYRPIQNFLAWYSIDKESPTYKLLTYASNGLEKLSKSYEEDSIIHHSIKLYILMLQNKESMQSDDREKELNTLVYTEFKKLYTESEIMLIVNMLELMNKECDEEKVFSLMHSVETLIKLKEKKIYLIVKESSTIL